MAYHGKIKIHSVDIETALHPVFEERRTTLDSSELDRLLERTVGSYEYHHPGQGTRDKIYEAARRMLDQKGIKVKEKMGV